MQNEIHEQQTNPTTINWHKRLIIWIAIILVLIILWPKQYLTRVPTVRIPDGTVEEILCDGKPVQLEQCLGYGFQIPSSDECLEKMCIGLVIPK